MDKKKVIRVKLEHKIPEQDVMYLLDSASRGIEYWGESSLGFESEARNAMSSKGTKVRDNEEEKTHILTIGKIRKGLKLMAEKEPEAFNDFTSGDYDMYTGDTFVQLCLFGEVIYG